LDGEDFLISHCANPDCGEPFVYLRTGRLFAVPRRTVSATRATVEYFWLCGRCAEVMQPEFTNHELVHCTLVTRHARRTRLRS
jgi:hypothetical protein